MRSIQDLVSLIAESGLFEAEWYLKEYPDVSMLGMNPIEHYLRYGEMLGRNPSAAFDTKYYLRTYPDIAEHETSPFYHFIVHGRSEGRLPCDVNKEREDSEVQSEELISRIAESDLFDAEWYLKEYPDVPMLGMNPIEHYLRYGEMLGRNPSTAFDTKHYLFSYPDIAEHKINPLYHFIVHGRSEGRLPNAKIENEELEIQLGSDVSNYFVPLLDATPLIDKPVRLIAFYLPQFHAIPENDDWWGNGFTEWTNVQPAQPQFVGHYQPHVPGELGYYNLLDLSVQHRQVELAKLYGIEGFCFYFYWFGGKRMLETPIENYLNEPSLDLPFCLCWANENWSRRWDGLDSEILIAQQHSSEDDLAFIESVARHMRDQRYIRIDGKPLLLVYRPSLLPSPIETSERWRKWCMANGIGEIYLAYTQSFETVDPAIYGFDAAVEFPPNNSAPPNVTQSVKPLRDDFNSIVYDWRALAERSYHYTKPEYTLFRGVCPSWDNTARRKNKSSILLNSSPHRYQKWLYNAIGDTCERFANPDERLVFINAWNEWAEGAHLEPDQRYGYAYLEATRMALVRSGLTQTPLSLDRSRPLAIVIHAFYEDIFDEMLGYLENIQSTPFKLYITTPYEMADTLRRKLLKQKYSFLLFSVKNHGRDVLPFIKIMPEILNGKHDFLIKVHTKKSRHRQDGDVWRNDIFKKLLTDSAIVSNIDYLIKNPEAGILGPTGHVVPISLYWGSNAARVTLLASRMGVDSGTLKALNFVAGTMFIARISPLIPLLNLAIDEEDFESEAGQVDGTLAHAIERLLSISAHAIRLAATCRNNMSNENYNFANRCES